MGNPFRCFLVSGQSRLRPFLSSRRQENIQKALQISRLLHLGKVFFLEKKEEDGYV